MYNVRARFFWVYVFLIAGFLISCSPKVTPPGANIIYGGVDMARYSYHYWEEGLAILFWHNFVGGESCTGAGSTEDPVYRLECHVESEDGQSFGWEVNTQDGMTADLWIDGQRYDLSQGNMFLISTGESGFQVEQLQRDFSKLESSNDAISALASNDPDVAGFIARYETVSDSSEAADGYGLTQLEDALRLASQSVEIGGPVGQSFFYVPGQLFVVGGEDVQVFEYPDSAAAQTVAAQISPDATTVGNSTMSWAITPHFYTKGRLIVLYVGENDAVKTALMDALGDPIAVGQPVTVRSHDESPTGSGPGNQDLLTTLPEALINNQYDMLSEVIGDPFGLGFWGSRTRILNPEGVIEELQSDLIHDTNGLAFTTDRDEFPDLGDYDPEDFWGSEGWVVDLIFSQGWGPDGQGEAILVIGLKSDGSQFWPAMTYSPNGFSEVVAQPSTEPVLSYDPAVYRNEADNFEFSYPEHWDIEELVFGSRASGAQFYISGQPIFSATVYLWDPKNDLDAYSEHRKLGWSSSSTIVAEEELTLMDGNRAVQFEIQGPDGSGLYSLLTEVGENYLELLGPVELNEFAEIAQTLHFLPDSDQ